jgi:hypothetical protein
MRRMGECHVYIELFKPELNGKPYGHYGVTAFEATALGCKVITQNLHPDVYQDAYVESPFFLAKDKNHFAEILYLIRNWDINSFLPKQEFFETHSIQSTGKRIKKIIS